MGELDGWTVFFIGLILYSAVGAVWAWWTGRKPGKEERIRETALTLAIESHGNAAGASFDRCYTARAEHFEKYLTTGKGGPS